VTLLGRIPLMEIQPSYPWRETLFLCDENQSFTAVGESDPTGDQAFFALSRQAKCIHVVVTQSIRFASIHAAGESWRTLLQTFRTKIFLALSDDFSARTASELCGKQETLKLGYPFRRTMRTQRGEFGGFDDALGGSSRSKETLDVDS
jgi:TraM recognition site of TraD and TraG